LAAGGLWRRAAPFAAFVLVIAVVYADPLFTTRNFAGRDIVGFNLPIEKTIHDAYRRGSLPVWFPHISGGRPLLPNPNAGSLYPVRVAFSVLPFRLAMRIFPVLHWCIAGIGVLLWCRSSGRSRSASWIAGVTYVFSGASVTEVFFSNIQPGMALLPWAMWALSKPAGRYARMLAVATVFGLLFLIGDVFACVLAVAAAILWIALEVPRDRQVPGMLELVASLGLAGLLAAPQILASALWVPLTNRAILGMKLRETLLYSTSPLRLLEFVVPYPFGATWDPETGDWWALSVFQYKGVGFFSTLYAGAFAAVAPFVAWRERAAGARFARTLLISCLALSVLPSLVPRSLIDVVSPIPLRYPEKFGVGAVLALAFLAAIAFDRIRARRQAPGGWLVVGGALSAIALIAAVFPRTVGRAAIGVVAGDPSAAPGAGAHLAEAFAEAGLLWMATGIALSLAASKARPRLALSLAILTIVPVAATRRIARSYRAEEIFAPSAFDRVMNRADAEGRYRTLGEIFRGASTVELEKFRADPGQIEASGHNWEQYTHALWSRGTVFNMDFDHGDLSRLNSLRGLATVASDYLDSAVFWRSVSLRWGVRFRDRAPLAGYRPVRRLGDQFLDELPGAYPDMRLVTGWVEQPNALAAANAIPRLPEGAVVLETGRVGAHRARPGSLQLLRRTAEGFHARVASPDPSWLFVLRGYWPYRRVLVDGGDVEPVPAQVAFSAIPIAPGRHEVEWAEEVPGAGASFFGPLLFGIAAVGLTIAARRSRRWD
jgi:hypothetical protein